MLKQKAFQWLRTLYVASLLVCVGTAASEEPFDTLRSFYALDAHIPQEVHVAFDEEADGIRTVELSFSAYDNEIVPARLQVPTDVENPPVIILLHGLTQSREQWWRKDGGPYSFPSSHRAALLKAGFAVMAFDARKHGDRLTPTDFADPGVYLYKSYFDASRKFIAETALDVRSAVRALDKIEGIDTNKIGVAGFSLGAFVGYLATAVEPRIKAGFFIALPLFPITEGQTASFTSPYAYAEGIAGRPMGLLVGTEDQLYSREGIEALAASMGKKTEVTWVECGHDFPTETAAVTVAFFLNAF